jgi:hypothetical protein
MEEKSSGTFKREVKNWDGRRQEALKSTTLRRLENLSEREDGTLWQVSLKSSRRAEVMCKGWAGVGWGVGSGP